MQSHLSRLFLVAAVCLATPVAARAQRGSPAEEAMELARQGKVDRAVELLRQHLQRSAKDAEAREALGNLLVYDGQSDEAVKQWERCMTGAESDYRFLMAIGDARLRQGQDGPYITRRRGMIGAAPNQDKDVETAFKRSHLELAVAAYEKLRKLRPDEEDAAVLWRLSTVSRKSTPPPPRSGNPSSTGSPKTQAIYFSTPLPPSTQANPTWPRNSWKKPSH